MGTAYIAGKISGNKRYKEQFSAAARFLRSCGFETVFNPATMIPDTADPATAMRICLSAIDVSDAVFFLPNWRDSPGQNWSTATVSTSTRRSSASRRLLVPSV